MVEGKGQFSVRGGIIDVYPADALSAVRIEFFDDELDSIRAVDVMSQRSQGNMQEVVIPPASEAPVPQAGTEALARLLLEALARQEAVAKRARAEKATMHLWRICRWRRAKSPRRRPSPAKTARWSASAKSCARRSARCKTA